MNQNIALAFIVELKYCKLLAPHPMFWWFNREQLTGRGPGAITPLSKKVLNFQSY